MKNLYLTSSAALILIGLVHTVFGILSGKEFSSEILWFISTGLFISIVGLLNFALAKRQVQFEQPRAVQIVNLLCGSFFMLLVLADPMPIGFVLLIAQMINSVASWKIVRQQLNCCHNYQLHSNE